MTLIVNGMDISPYVAADGFKWVSNDLHDESSGRTLDGTMHVYRIGKKEQIEVSLIPVNATVAAQILSKLSESPEFSATYTSPELGPRTATVYCSSRNCEFLRSAAVAWWKSIKFTLTEC